MKLGELAKRLGVALEGDSEIDISRVASLKEAAPGDVSFLSNLKYAALVEISAASAVIVPSAFDRSVNCALLRAANSDQAFGDAAMLFYEAPPDPAVGVHPSAVVASDVVLGEKTSIGANCTIEPGVVIGAHTVIGSNSVVGYKTQIGANACIYPSVTMREFSRIGDRVIIHSGTVVGSDGFGYTVQEDGTRTKIPQIGYVVIEDDVEVGANVAIDRARFDKTVVGRGSKIDNLVQIAHNVVIGEHSVLCGQVGISGSTKVGSKCILAGQAGIGGHLDVGDGAVVLAKAGVMRNIEPGGRVMGCPALPHLDFKKICAITMALPKLRNRLKTLESRLDNLAPKYKT